MRGYMGYTWFSFTFVKAPPHPVSDGNTTNRNTGRISPTPLSHGQTAEGIRGASGLQLIVKKRSKSVLLSSRRTKIFHLNCKYFNM